MDRVRKNALQEGTNDHSKQLMLVVVNMTFSIHKEFVYVPSHGKVNII